MSGSFSSMVVVWRRCRQGSSRARAAEMHREARHGRDPEFDIVLEQGLAHAAVIEIDIHLQPYHAVVSKVGSAEAVIAIPGVDRFQRRIGVAVADLGDAGRGQAEPALLKCIVKRAMVETQNSTLSWNRAWLMPPSSRSTSISSRTTPSSPR